MKLSQTRIKVLVFISGMITYISLILLLKVLFMYDDTPYNTDLSIVGLLGIFVTMLVVTNYYIKQVK